ncbi:MAG TPA: PQQ-dependent sugar dehydrogenase [Solirubrobacterales bacterium]|nr:PQQ-dependent sugar dehydrogenase [Solirubrobacterales bacterium]
MFRHPAKTLLLVLGSALLLALLPAPAMGALSLPSGFQARTLPLPKATSPSYENGLQKPTTLDFAPEGKLFVAERNGRVLEFDSIEDPTPTLVLSILAKVMAKGDRGILGMKLDPEYPSKPYIYLSYTYDAPIGGDYEDSTHTHYADGADDCKDGENNMVDCLVSGRLARVRLDPTTSVAVDGAGDPDPYDPGSEQVLVNSWCQQVTSHSIGDIEFDSAGALLMSGGDGASWGSLDYGQLGNPCGDPPYEGGSLRAQDLRTPATAGDPTNYNGSIIRVNRETGAAMVDDPLALAPLSAGGVEDVAARRILSQGNRNPYRFTIQPGTSNVYIGDVGMDLWEEIDRLTSPPAPGQGLTNFGWPCYEGGPNGNIAQPRWQQAEKELHKPLCEALYTNPSKVTAPFFAYPHPLTPGYDGHLFPGDACNPSPGSAVAGLSFYDPTGNPADGLFPTEFHGALFFSDAARGCIWTMEAGAGGAPDPASVANFAVKGGGESFTPVDVVEGPDGSLYVPNFYADSIVQIKANTSPTAQLDVVEGSTYGPAPLKLEFSAAGSSDPDPGDTLTYGWDLDGDGQFDDGNGATAEREYVEAVNVTVRLRVEDDLGHTDVAEVKLYPGDEGPPSVTIVKPTASLEWAVGQAVDYEATATDPDLETFAAGLDAHWEFILVHCPLECHEHGGTSSDSPSGSFVPGPHEYPSHLKLVFTATDSRGMSDSETVEIYPRLVEVGVASEPAGIPLSIEGTEMSEPFSATMMAGGSLTVSAPAETVLGAEPYVFLSWSDGDARVHEVTSLDNLDLVARFVPKPSDPKPPEPEDGDGGGELPSPPPTAAPAPGMAHLRLASRPPGVKLRLGSVRRAAPFAAEVGFGTHTFLAAPKEVRKADRVLRFKGWTSGGRKLGAAARRALVVGGDAAYLAVYAATAQRPRGR